MRARLRREVDYLVQPDHVAEEPVVHTLERECLRVELLNVEQNHLVCRKVGLESAHFDEVL
jgi:hypothetical protein